SDVAAQLRAAFSFGDRDNAASLADASAIARRAAAAGDDERVNRRDCRSGGHADGRNATPSFSPALPRLADDLSTALHARRGEDVRKTGKTSVTMTITAAQPYARRA